MSIQNDIWTAVKKIILDNVHQLANKVFFEDEQIAIGEYYLTAKWGTSEFDEVGTSMRQRITPLILTLHKKKGARSRDINIYKIADTITSNIPMTNAPTWYYFEPETLENEIEQEGYIGCILTFNFWTAEQASC